MPRMDKDDNESQEGVIRRRLILCETLQRLDTADLIRTCEYCCNFLVYCCGCQKNYGSAGLHGDGKMCHHFRLIFTDGACRSNGQSGATAGIGVAMGTVEKWQYAIPITTHMDHGQRRTSQRAELLAALSGLQRMVAIVQLSEPGNDGEKSWVIATDSEYVVKGMTEWLPAWKLCIYMHSLFHNTLNQQCGNHLLTLLRMKNNRLRNSRNAKPANLDLFLQLDAALIIEEIKGIKVGFWHVPRKHNTIADKLAKEAAQFGDTE
ncbi:MAG: hypothetical protein Q9205_002453 [Flavoplaca limonia]